MFPLARDDVFVSRAGIQACFRRISCGRYRTRGRRITARRFGKIRFKSAASGGLADFRM